MSQYYVDLNGREKVKSKMNKPAYQVPTMQEIQVLPWNGFKVASTFSGCGGSCTGYRMAGFKVVWANEFVPAAQESYKANADAGCYLDRRDIKNVRVEEIFEVTGLKQGELDLFDGSPPCQAFSTAGKREKGWGKDKTYEHGAKQKNETLFDEYVRLLRGLKPKVFVAENVSGLLKGTAKGYFIEIITALKKSGYRVKCKLLDAQWLGVPQQRQRTIFIGIREDLNLEPVYPKPLPYNYSVREALPWITKAEHDISGLMSCGNITDKPSPTVMAGRAGSHFVLTLGAHGFQPEIKRDLNIAPCSTVAATGLGSYKYHVETPTEKRKFTIAELKRICGFPDDFILTGSYAQQWERLGNSVPPVMMFHIAKTIRDEILVSIKRIEA